MRSQFTVYANAYGITTSDGKEYLFKVKPGGEFSVSEEVVRDDLNLVGPEKEMKECHNLPIEVFYDFIWHYVQRITKKSRGAMLTIMEGLGGEDSVIEARKSLVNQMLFNPTSFG